MSIRLYLAPRINDGRIHNVLRDIVSGLEFDEIRDDNKMLGICIVDTDDGTHATLAADARVIPLSRLVSDSAALDVEMDSAADDLPSSAAIKTALSGLGIPTGWITSSNSIKDVVRFIGRLFVVGEIGHYRERIAAMDALGKLSLSSTFQDLTQVQRTAVRTWITNHGMDSTWIINPTTIGEILIYIVNNIQLPGLRLGNKAL